MALPMMLIMITGEIDLSVASMLGMSGALLGDLLHHGWPIWRRDSRGARRRRRSAACSTAC